MPERNHNPRVGGSSPSPATMSTTAIQKHSAAPVVHRSPDRSSADRGIPSNGQRNVERPLEASGLVGVAVDGQLSASACLTIPVTSLESDHLSDDARP